ncbi:hypothetical protein CASFOL_031504 [Castilleja foliolosa]|uniref:Uncharacterized protein n=1 Tax=Castilleja foliolosa TaxID=1961234 RepID=A0ABD3C6T4_9LAMI
MACYLHLGSFLFLRFQSRPNILPVAVSQVGRLTGARKFEIRNSAEHGNSKFAAPEHGNSKFGDYE